MPGYVSGMDYKKVQELMSQAMSRQCPILDILIVNASAMS